MALHQLGRIYQLQGNYTEAAELYRQSLDIARELGDKQGIATTLHQLGMIDEQSKDYENALRKYALALSIFEGLKDPNRYTVTKSISRLKDKMGEDAFGKALDNLKGF